jgi:hypothetical protein
MCIQVSATLRIVYSVLYFGPGIMSTKLLKLTRVEIFVFLQRDHRKLENLIAFSVQT